MGKRNLAGSYRPTIADVEAVVGIPQQQQHLRPEARIARVFNIKDWSNGDKWGDYINTLGSKNRMTGTTRSVGQLAVTYRSAYDISRLLARKYECFNPESRDYRRMHSTLRSLSGDYRQYVNERASTVVRKQNEILGTGETIKPLWLDGCFELESDLFPGTRDQKVLMLKPTLKSREILEDEVSATDQFLRAEGLPVNMLDRADVHLTVLKLFKPFGTVAVRTVIPPAVGVSLMSPHMEVADNRPPRSY